MGAEFPPVILDGSNCIPTAGDSFDAPVQASMRADTGAAATTKLDPAAVASLYLIRNNLLHHEGDFRLDAVELLWTEDANPGVGRSREASTSLSSASIIDHGSGLSRVGASAKEKVRSIRLKGRQELLRYGQDFHNFLLILQPRR